VVSYSKAGEREREEIKTNNEGKEAKIGYNRPMETDGRDGMRGRISDRCFRRRGAVQIFFFSTQELRETHSTLDTREAEED